MEDIKILSDLFKKIYGLAPVSVVAMPGAGSGRRYYRLTSGSYNCIGVAGENLRDCRAFVNLDKIFYIERVPVPEVYAVADSGMYYLQEDLGDLSLFNLITATCAGSETGLKDVARDEGKDNDRREVEELVASAMKSIAKMQCVPRNKWENAVEYSPFSRRQVFWDLNYFKYEFVKPSRIDFDEERLENDFENFADSLLDSSEELSGFMYRDFQSRNVMVKSGECKFIDFQGGRHGPSLYDAVSFLWQAKAGFSKEFRKRMMHIYAEEYGKIKNIPASRILDKAPLFALFRTLQVLGAYGLRGLVERKAHFLESITPALKNLSELIKEGVADSYPELKKVAQELASDERFLPKKKKDYLTIHVFSFSYKKGYPEDYSGNGGGFMFDCRGMHNPGRYKEYKALTGLDRPVIDFLKEKGEVDIFSRKAFELMLPSVERYINRGFTNLQIGFGCTGGQHRSVYCAEAVAKMLAERFPTAVVELNHREQRIKKRYNDKK